MTARLWILTVMALGIVAYLVLVPPPAEDTAGAVVAAREPTHSRAAPEPPAPGEAASSELPAQDEPTTPKSPEPAPVAEAGARTKGRVLASASPEALFATQSWYVAPPPPPPPPPPPAVVMAPPVAPPLPFTFMGSYTRKGEARVFYLARGTEVFDVHIGDVIEDTYHVDGVVDGNLQLTYKPLNEKQTLVIGDGQ